MDSFLYFSFLQGVLAFLAPCAVALLPAYIAAFVSRGHTPIIRGLKLAAFSVLGILVVYVIAGLLIVVASEILKNYLRWITMALGVVVAILGVFFLLGKTVYLNLHLKDRKFKNESREAWFFGMAYAVGALGCLFPLFLVVATQALVVPLVNGVSYIVAYFVGLSGMMVLTILLATVARDRLDRQLRKILPHMNWILGILLIVAGVYIVNYQLALF